MVHAQFTGVHVQLVRCLFDNDFIKIVVRTGPEETGRFALDTPGNP